ncbi:MAG: helix-turn-helix transcriptional regulator [Chloroflexi bacterium]|nr:helix-turn-helix transcriptional regulator [Chloroflexota bacterium]MBU1749282.1 helix-turn-helix transcriptional regulator [Chloroflexota bacterium]
MPSDSELVQFVRREIKRLGYNQTQLAARAGLTQQTLSKLTTGKTIPNPQTCEKLAYALECDPAYLRQLAGHEVPGQEEQTLEASLRRAIVPYLPKEASIEVVEEMVAQCLRDVQDIGFKHNIIFDINFKQARARLDELNFDYRAIDPLNSRVLTAIFQGDQVFYVTGQLNEQGDEINRSAISNVQLNGADWAEQRSKFLLQVWPLAGSFDTGAFLSMLQSQDPYTTHCWIPQYGDSELAWQFRAVFPAGGDVAFQDNLVREAQLEQLSKGITPGLKRGIEEKERVHAKRLKAKEQYVLSEEALRRPEAILINPDALSYLILLAQVSETGTYWILQGKLFDLAECRWPMALSDPIPSRNDALQGTFSNLAYLGGHCLDISKMELEHSRAGRHHRITKHIILCWRQGDYQFLGVASPDLGIWRVLQVNRTEDKFFGIDVAENKIIPGSLEDRRVGVELSLLERRKDLEDRSIRYVTM